MGLVRAPPEVRCRDCESFERNPTNPTYGYGACLLERAEGLKREMPNQGGRWPSSTCHRAKARKGLASK
jgi:hypothetical protein